MGIQKLAEHAKAASRLLAAVDTETKNAALAAIATALQENGPAITAANEADLAKAQADQLAAPLLKRLRFDQASVDAMCEGMRSLIALEDPVGRTIDATQLDEGFELYKVSCPLGVIGVIFESRPDALVQISTLCLKSGNAVLLKGGSEAAHTNRILADTIARATASAGIPDGWIQLLETREEVTEMLSLDQEIDLIVPRGSNDFVRYIMENTTIAVMGHADGICHVYVDGQADLEMANRVVLDSKCQYVAVCNAAETLLVDTAVAATFLPMVQTALVAEGTEIRGCEKTRAIIQCETASEEDWRTEYLDYTLSIRVVAGLDEAIDHINQFGSGHTDCIVTKVPEKAAQFMTRVDAGNVFWNSSSRFSDGFRYGLGAEVGVSTNKIHARGPVGLEGLAIYKWKLLGQGHTVGAYGGKGRRFKHRKLDKKCPL